MIRRIWSVTRTPDICHFSVIKAPPPPDQTDTFYQQQDTKFRLVASVRCYNVSQTFHPVARCYYRLHWTRHSKHPKPARPSDLRPNTRTYSPEICDRAYGDHRVSTGVKSARSWVFPVDRDVSGRERSACVPLSHAHARSRSQGWECRNVTFSPVCWQDTRTWKPGIVGIWVQRQWLFLRNILLLFYGILSQYEIFYFVFQFIFVLMLWKYMYKKSHANKVHINKM